MIKSWLIKLDNISWKSKVSKVCWKTTSLCFSQTIEFLVEYLTVLKSHIIYDERPTKGTTKEELKIPAKTRIRFRLLITNSKQHFSRAFPYLKPTLRAISCNSHYRYFFFILLGTYCIKPSQACNVVWWDARRDNLGGRFNYRLD
jgi:hypothetical protein